MLIRQDPYRARIEDQMRVVSDLETDPSRRESPQDVPMRHDDDIASRDAVQGLSDRRLVEPVADVGYESVASRCDLLCRPDRVSARSCIHWWPPQGAL